MDGKIDRLSIKADRSGIAVYIPENLSADEICCELYAKIMKNIGAFQKKGNVRISFKGNAPSQADSDKILKFLNSIDMINVGFIIRTDDDIHGVDDEMRCEPAVQEYPIIMSHRDDSRGDKPDNRPYIFRGDIRRKQVLEINGNVIILGNVAKDATVISGKNIIVIGELNGTAIAGRMNRTDSFVMAMSMCPRLIQIGSAKVFYPQIKSEQRSPVIATNDGSILNITYI